MLASVKETGTFCPQSAHCIGDEVDEEAEAEAEAASMRAHERTDRTI